MKTYTTKALMLTLFTLWLELFGVSASHAVTLSEAQKLLASDSAVDDVFGGSVSISGDTAVIASPPRDGIGIVGRREFGAVYVFVRDSAGVWREQQKLIASDGAGGDFFGSSVSISGDTAVIGAQFDADNGGNSGSAYVFVRDGTGVWSEQQKLTASDGAMNDTFGSSVSISGDTAVIGAFQDDETGSAYVYVRDGAGVWSEQQKLTASDGAAFDNFGDSVSISGDTAVIGAVGDADNGDLSGSAYVFVRDGVGVWSEQQKLTASDAAMFGTFGVSVSIAGDTAVIGATAAENTSGSAYVYVRDGAGVWSEQQKLNSSDGVAGDAFGVSVSIVGDTAVIGALGDNGDGSAYVYVRDGSGVWSEQQKLSASDGAAGDSFGRTVSISGDAAVIGAERDADNGFFSGSAYMYVRDGSGVWSEQQKLTASDGAEFDNFGSSVSIAGETVVIGANGGDSSNHSGSAYVYVRDGSGVWSEQQKLIASDGAVFDNFGSSVSIAGDTAVIGAWGDSDNGSASGSAYVYVRDGSGVWSEQQKLTASDAAIGDRFGFSVSLSGDTAVFGAPGDDDNGPFTGSVYVYVRDSSGVWSEQQKLTASDGAEFDNFGRTVSIAGDTALIGTPGDDDNGSISGSVYVYVRDGSGVWSEQQKLNPSDAAEGDTFGVSVSIAGDTAVIGAERDSDNGPFSGSAYVYVRDGSGVWSEQQKLTASDGAVDDAFGVSVSIAGDTALIGAERDDDNGSESGSAYVFEARDPVNPLMIEKLINHRVRDTPATAVDLLVGTRYRVEYKVTNNSPNRIYSVQVFEAGQLVCNLYALNPGESKQRHQCANSQVVLGGLNAVPANATAKVSGSNQILAADTEAYYLGFGNEPGKLKVTHYVNEKNADTQTSAVEVTSNQVEVKFRVENTGSINLYRIKLYHDPASPTNSGWQELCYKGTLVPGEVRYCKRTISVTEGGLNKAFGRAQGQDANVSPMGIVNASNPTYFNVVLP